MLIAADWSMLRCRIKFHFIASRFQCKRRLRGQCKFTQSLSVYQEDFIPMSHVPGQSLLFRMSDTADRVPGTNLGLIGGDESVVAQAAAEVSESV